MRLKSIFQGHREFFKGLAIDKTDYDWKPHAVIHFNWGMVDLIGLNFDSKTRHLVDAQVVGL